MAVEETVGFGCVLQCNVFILLLNLIIITTGKSNHRPLSPYFRFPFLSFLCSTTSLPVPMVVISPLSLRLNLTIVAIYTARGLCCSSMLHSHTGNWLDGLSRLDG